MRTSRIAVAAAVGGLALTVAMPAAAQFDTLHNHLKCYKIKGPSLAVSLVLDNQFGRERVFKLVPDTLCLPTQKTCCDPAQPGCVPVPCGLDPVPATPVPHFKCYKVKAKQCVDPGCTTLVGKFVKPTVTLVDQFHTEVVQAGPPKTLCVPVLKGELPTTTTSTSSTTTTTMRPCLTPDATGLCAGDCPPQTKCLATSPTSCDCVPDQEMCMGDGTACAGFCPNVNQVCAQVSPTVPCDCFTPCDRTAPACDGACPPGSTCVPDAVGGGCRCG